MFIDIHTHKNKEKPESVYNVILGRDIIIQKGWFSLGVHPWYLENYEKQLIVLKLMLRKGDQNFVFIGECGLDKLIDVDIALQIKVFELQIELSEKYRKPLVIHCVKFYNELLKLKKEMKPTQYWIIHGFNRKKSIADSLLANGFCLSFGIKYLKTSNGKEVLKNMSLQQLFFETDDDIDVSIEEVYNLASEILQIELEELKIQIKKNLWKVTGWKEQNC